MSKGNIIIDDTKNSNPNLLHNWYFADPINQRNGSSFSGYSYTVDRWGFNSQADGTLVITENGLLLNSGFFFQRVDPEIIAKINQPMTFSMLIDDKIYSVTFTPQHTNNDLIMKYTDFGSIYFEQDANSNYMPQCTIDIYHSPDKPARLLQAAKLEFGNIQTLAYKEDGRWILNDPPPDKALELLKCQRYYWQSDVIFNGTWVSSLWISVSLKFPAKMRIKPDVTIYSTLGTPNMFTDYGGQDTGVTMNTYNGTNEGILSFYTSSNPDGKDKQYEFKIVADAEL